LGESRRLVILGDPGAGKTTLLRWFATAFLLRLTNNSDFYQMPDIDSLPEQPWLPLVVRCRELDTQCLQSCTLDDILRRTLQKAELESGELELQLLRNELAAGRLILLIDGLDEIAAPTLRASFCAQLERISDTYPEAPMIVTSRIVGYREMGYPIGKGFEHGVLAELTKEDKDNFIRRWCDVTESKEEQLRAEKELIEAMHASDRIERLTGNPMMLTTMALVKRKVGKLPTRRNELYREAVGVLLNWRSDLYGPVDDREAYPQLEYIAYAMCDRGVQQLRRDEIIGLLEDVRRDFPNIRAIQNRTPEEFLTVMEAQTGLIVEVGEQRHDGLMQPVYEFRHLTFQEYLAGLALIAGPFPGYESGSTLGERLSPLAGRVVKTEYRGFEVTENWREAIRLCISCFNDGVVDEALQAVLHSPDGKEDERICRPRAILALLCLADEPNVSENVGIEIVISFVGTVELNLNSASTDSEIVQELSTSFWCQSVIEHLSRRCIYLDGVPRGNMLYLIADAITWNLSEEVSMSKSWAQQQVLNLKKNEEAAIAAAIMLKAAVNRVRMVPGLIDALLALIDKSEASAHAATWALFWLSGGSHVNNGPLWVPKPKELAQLVDYLNNPKADNEALRFVIYIFKNKPSQSAVAACIGLMHRGYFVTQRAAFSFLGAVKHPLATEALYSGLSDSEKTIRCLALESLVENHEGRMDSKLLTEDVDESGGWLDPKEPIKQSHVDKAIEQLDIAEQEVISRLSKMAEKYGLTLAF
jgi:hypothetical protein